MRELPGTLREALVALRDYCNSYFREQLSGSSLPAEFWEIEDDDLYMEVLGFMPLFVMPDVVAQQGVPRGFVIAYPVMFLEDGYLTDGYTTFSNAGPDGLAWAIESYRTIGLPEEADALEAVRRAMVERPDDEDAWIEAYESATNPYSDDDLRHQAMSKWFCSNRALFAPRGSREKHDPCI